MTSPLRVNYVGVKGQSIIILQIVRLKLNNYLLVLCVCICVCAYRKLQHIVFTIYNNGYETNIKYVCISCFPIDFPFYSYIVPHKYFNFIFI